MRRRGCSYLPVAALNCSLRVGFRAAGILRERPDRAQSCHGRSWPLALFGAVRTRARYCLARPLNGRSGTTSMAKTALVVGASAIVGSATSGLLVEQGWTVSGLARARVTQDG